MQSRAAYSWITNQTLHNFSSTVQTFQWWMSATRSVFKQSVQNVHQLQQHMIKVSCEMIRLPYKWTPVANHFISPTKQSSARQCWSALACISDSVPASRPTHGNPLDSDLANLVSIHLFQWNQGNSSGSNLVQKLLCELGLHLARRWSCLTGNVCSLWSDLARAWWRRVSK